MTRLCGPWPECQFEDAVRLLSPGGLLCALAACAPSGDLETLPLSADSAVPHSGRGYTLQAVDFHRSRYKTAADCLNAASVRRLPLEICR
jgi:hypothetical protein